MSLKELAEKIPAAVPCFSRAGNRRIQCGEPILGTLERAARENGFAEDDIG